MAGPSRRAVFVGGGALLAVAYVSAHVVGHWPLPLRQSPSLGSGSRQTLEAALEVFLPEGAPVGEVAGDIDTFLADGDSVQAEQLRLALWLLEHLGGAGPLSFRRFTRLSLDERQSVLATWRLSSLNLKRQVFQGLRKTALFAWYSRPHTWNDIGYDGPWVGR